MPQSSVPEDLKENVSLLHTESVDLDRVDLEKFDIIFESHTTKAQHFRNCLPLWIINASDDTVFCVSWNDFSWFGLLKQILLFFVPTFLRGISSKTSSETLSSTRHISTYAHLDGLRGLAALFVFFFHSSYTIWNVYAGYRPTPELNSFLRLPFIRLLYAGDAMVAVFFIISGFVLSVKPIKLMHSGSSEDVYKCISSAAFRRGFRLFIPCFISTFLIMIVIQLGAFEGPREFVSSDAIAYAELHPPMLPTFWGQLWHWCQQTFNFIHFWNWEDIYAGNTAYDVHLWTIPAEYRCSMILFITQIAVGRMSVRHRLGVLISLIVYATMKGRFEMMEFWLGCVLAQFDILKRMRVSKFQETLLVAKPDSKANLIALAKRTAWFLLFILGLYMLSIPSIMIDRTSGYHILCWLTPPGFARISHGRFWQGIGATLITLCINNVQGLQWFFACRPIEYLGRISFATYLVHFCIIHTLGYRLLPLMWSITSTSTDAQKFLGWLMAQTLTTFAVIYAADIFWINVDLPTNKICHKLEGWFFADRDQA